LKITDTEEAIADVADAIRYLNERNPTAAAELDDNFSRCLELLGGPPQLSLLQTVSLLTLLLTSFRGRSSASSAAGRMPVVTGSGGMRLRILTRPTGTIDGIPLDQFCIGRVYEVGTQVACVLLAEGWAGVVTDDEGVAFVRPPPEIAKIEPLILVVDDEPDMRRFTESLLTAHGYHFIVAVHGRDAIQRLRERCPGRIVLDLNMPVLDGWGFRTEQRDLADRTRAAVPVLVMTGEDHAATHADTLRAVGVIKKPFHPETLIDAVAAAIRLQGSGSDSLTTARPIS